jgi:RHS repeat-associated protein
MKKTTAQLILACFYGFAAQFALAETLTRTSAFEYDANGLLVREVIEPDSSAFCLVTTYTYDTFGNRATATIRNCNGASSGGLTEAAAPTGNPVFQSRTTQTAYAAGTQTVGGSLSWSAGQFPTTNTNALGHQEQREYDPRFGALSKLTGPNGLSTTWTYDAFGRKASETRSDGQTTNWAYGICGACPTHGRYFVTETTLEVPTKTTYFDSLNREIRTEIQGFDGTLVRKDTEYDSVGRVQRISKPYYAGGTVAWTTYQYDVLGRPTQIEEPATASGTTRTATDYNGLTTTVTVSNAGGTTNMPNGSVQTLTTLKNSQGQVVQVTDAQGNITSYTYDPFGSPKTTTAAGVVTTLSFDVRARKKQMVDPDLGTWDYDYNALGELIWQRDAKLQITTMTYDKLGRMTARSEADLVSNWYYDKDQGGTTCKSGRLCQVTASNNYGRTISYDSQARVASLTTTIDSAYTVSYTYDSRGRLDTTTYPTGFAVQNVYNARGYLWKVQRVNDPDTTVYWTANSVNAAGEVAGELLGNGLTTTRSYDALFRMTGVQSGTIHNLAYTFDAVGNVTQRVDSGQPTPITENFTYDTLNRLLSSTGSGLTTRCFNYSAIGNMTYKSDVGAYTYPAVTAARPHAVSHVENGGAPNSITADYFYDANGSLRTASGTIYTALSSVPFAKALAYTSFNMPNAICEARGTGSAAQVLQQGGVDVDCASSGGIVQYKYSYTYSAEHERVRLVTVRPTDTLTSIYLHPAGKGALLYEKEFSQLYNRYEHKHYVNGGSGPVGVFVTKSTYGTGEGPEMRYYHRDHLGSVAVITNPGGAVLDRLAYEAFGERRSPSGVPQDRESPIVGAVTDRGFTAHEHLDELNLIHMNGRIYDPALARFMTADPFIQAPSNLQSYNRYSYVLNSPLMYTDPTGYLSLKKLTKPISKALTRIVHNDVSLLIGEKNANKLLENKHFSLSAYMREGVFVAATGGIASPKELARFVREQPFQKDFDNVIMENPVLYMAGQWIATAATSWICAGCGGAIWVTYYTVVATGSNSAALRAGAITWATNYAGGQLSAAGLPTPLHMAASGALGGVSAELQGGDFKDGFVRSALMAGAVREGMPRLSAGFTAVFGESAPMPQPSSLGEAAQWTIRDGLNAVDNPTWANLVNFGRSAMANGEYAWSATNMDKVHIYYYRDFSERRDGLR